jgi:DedD protein
MAFFKFRKGSDDKAAPPLKSESIEAMRKRAMHRLIGAAVLVLAGVIGFPMLFDSQPRPIAVDIPIEIPDKNKGRPVAVAPVAEAPAPVAPPAVVVPSLVPAPAKANDIITELKDEAQPKKSEEKVAVVPVKPANDAIKKIAPPEAKVEVKVEVKAETKAQDGAKAQALLDGKPAATDERFVVQVGAFADAARAKEARTKVEQAGLKTYTQVVDTKDGLRTRVRVGPFSDKAEAEKAAQKIKSLALTATLLTL